MALNQPMSATLRMDGEKVRLEISCPNHKVLGTKEVTYHVDGKKVTLLCPLGCPLGEWESEESYMAEFRELAEGLKSLYFDVPPKK
jgi:hypothetical protein